MRLEHLRPDHAHTPLKGAQMRALIASGKQALEFAKDICDTARWARLHPTENLLPLPGKGSLLVRLQSRILVRCCSSWGTSPVSLPSCKTSSAAHAARSKETSDVGGVG